MPRTLVLDTAPDSHRVDVANVARLANRLGEVVVVDSVGSTAETMAAQVTAFCRQHPDVEHVIVFPATAVLPGWWRAARRGYRELPRRPRTVFVLPDSGRTTSRHAWQAWLGRATGTIHRAVAITDGSGPTRRAITVAQRPTGPEADDPHAGEVFYSRITGTPPFYTNPLTPLKYVGARILGRLRREVMRRMVRPTGRTDLERIGTDYGGWWVPPAAARPGAVAYCAGAGEDISFDLELHRRGCVVRTLDPTPRAITYVTGVAPDSDTFRFVPVGLWSHADELKFFAPGDGTSVSHSAVNLGGTSEHFLAPVRPLHEVATELGDDHIDLLKLDIEGSEYRVIDSILERGPLPDVLCIEFDQPVPLRKVAGAVRRLAADGGYALDRIDGWNFTFSRSATA